MIDTNTDMLTTVIKAILTGGLMKLPNNLDLGEFVFSTKNNFILHTI